MKNKGQYKLSQIAAKLRQGYVLDNGNVYDLFAIAGPNNPSVFASLRDAAKNGEDEAVYALRFMETPRIHTLMLELLEIGTPEVRCAVVHVLKNCDIPIKFREQYYEVLLNLANSRTPKLYMVRLKAIKLLWYRYEGFDCIKDLCWLYSNHPHKKVREAIMTIFQQAIKSKFGWQLCPEIRECVATVALDEHDFHFDLARKHLRIVANYS